jgi:hypothetical protein
VPVSDFLKFKIIETGKIHFPLDNNTPDCWLLNDNGTRQGIEVTIERGKEKYHLATELNEVGVGRGFIGIQDDASWEKFGKRMSSPRLMFSPEQALEATKDGILSCFSKKDNPRYEDVFFLLIQARLHTLPKKYWGSIIEELSLNATNLPFQEVYIIGEVDSEPRGFRVK